MTDRPDAWLAEVESAIPTHVGRQRWYSGDGPPDPAQVRVERVSELWESGGHRLWQVLVYVGDDLYQLLLGERPAGEPAEFLHGHESAVLGSAGASYFYDATLDPEMAKALLLAASGGRESVVRSRPLSVEQSNTSLVYDDRLIFKVFRRLRPGPNPDVEMTTALAEAGFTHVARPILRWSDRDYDFGFAQQYLTGGTDGWALALTSLRDLYSSDGSGPSEAGGDFADEGRRLGVVTAAMHVALSHIFAPLGGAEARAGWVALVDGLESRLDQAGQFAGIDLVRRAGWLIRDLKSVKDPGPAIRVHGDFHLGQVMRTDSGWCVLDFEGEPARTVEERRAPTSVLKDVTSMVRSFHYASRHAILERAVADWEHLDPLARSWESHNRRAFLQGYLAGDGIEALLPDPAGLALVMAGYELDKALYELAYERAHRPEWVSIPIDALTRLVDGQYDPASGL